MDILIGERNSGKTTQLIQMSAEGKGTIIVPAFEHVQEVLKKADEMGLTIPEPISWPFFIHELRGRRGPYLLDEVGLILSSMEIDMATLDAACLKDLPPHEENSQSAWAVKEIELAIASEKEAALKDTNDWKYGADCYESALRAYRSLLRDQHSGMSIQITKGILNRLIDGRCLTPIEDTPDIWTEVPWESENKEYQCARMSSLFKKVTPSGEVTYSDIDRVSCVNIESPNAAYHNAFATRLIDKIFPIKMPYLPPNKSFRLFTEEFLVDPKHGDIDTVKYLYILMPDGRKVELNRCFKEDDSNQMVPIEEEEYEARKAKKVVKK